MKVHVSPLKHSASACESSGRLRECNCTSNDFLLPPWLLTIQGGLTEVVPRHLTHWLRQLDPLWRANR